jgi:pimeloyl-ACP methyl ester carboxylesterase
MDRVRKFTYKSVIDGREDWALAERPSLGEDWVVCLHGHGSSGDQIYTRTDIRDHWLSYYRKIGLGVLSPNLRGNAWMCPEAVTDLHYLLDLIRKEYTARKFCFISGSMGATGNLIYATIHPEDVAAVAALGFVSNIVSYHKWCCDYPDKIRDEIRVAVESAYGGRPEHVFERYGAHIVTQHADKLTMPVLLSHGSADKVIPVEQARELRQCLSGAPNVTYIEIEGGGHDAPLFACGMPEWFDRLQYKK